VEDPWLYDRDKLKEDGKMKNLLESFAILLVGLLSVSIIYWIVQYSMIADEDMTEEINYEVPEKKQASKKAKTTDYLQNLEGYEDVDVQVDATKENRANTVVVKSELSKDALGDAVEDKSRSSYTENLENYAEPEKEEVAVEVEEVKPVADTASDPDLPEQKEVTDEIGMAIDAALDDI
jgi:preprotein translocase subunit SecF